MNIKEAIVELLALREVDAWKYELRPKEKEAITTALIFMQRVELADFHKEG